jgi:hypothetical protein
MEKKIYLNLQEIESSILENVALRFLEEKMVFDFMKKENVEKEKLNEKDKGFTEDLINILFNITHAEIHATLSFFKTNDENWLKISNEARKDRTELLDLITLKEDSEIWCWNKHTLVIILGLIELSNRKYSEGKIEEAKKYLEKSKKWLGLFMVKNKL